MDEILLFISNTVYRDSNNKSVLLSEHGLGRVKFFKANGEYYLFNTCNTWLAQGLKQAGVDITDDIILTEELFNEAAKIGTVIKAE